MPSLAQQAIAATLAEGPRHTLWIQERASDGKLSASLTKPTEVTGRLIAVTIQDGKFVDVTDGGFFTVPIATGGCDGR